jgi:uncharacterized integral membrane protein (TIGR00697 family)
MSGNVSFLKNKPSQMELYPIITALFCGCLIISNILASKTFSLYDIILPCGVVIFPLVYIVGDVLTEIYGFTLAKRTIYLGFIINLIAVIAYQIAIFLPGTDLATSNAFSIILGSTPRILIASLISYLVGSYVNAYFMKILKERYTNYLFARCSISTLFGEGLDAIIFITIAFAGLMPNEVLITMIICQGAFKIIYEIIVYPITRTVINWIKSLDDTPFAKIA